VGRASRDRPCPVLRVPVQIRQGMVPLAAMAAMDVECGVDWRERLPRSLALLLRYGELF
jgi:hypothetical protein